MLKRSDETTKEEILAMEPGRELDALVAEHVFGWIPIVNYKSGTLEWRRYSANGSLTVCPSHWKTTQPPAYSTDIEEAWEMLEKLGGGWIAKDSDGHEAGIYCNNQYRSEWIASCQRSAPEAICKAALLAKLEVNKC